MNDYIFVFNLVHWGTIEVLCFFQNGSLCVLQNNLRDFLKRKTLQRFSINLRLQRSNPHNLQEDCTTLFGRTRKAEHIGNLEQGREATNSGSPQTQPCSELPDFSNDSCMPLGRCEATRMLHFEQQLQDQSLDKHRTDKATEFQSTHQPLPTALVTVLCL